MRRVALALLDWFIPSAFSAERSKVGLARNFVVTTLLGPLLIAPIVVMLTLADPEPGWACFAMMSCVTAYWLLPFVFKLTGRFRLMALISVELLSLTALIGTSVYGGVTSPFLPWLLVSLMLGFFYLSDEPMRVVALFATNIVLTVGVNLAHRFPQHLGHADLATISWVSMFAATFYMSMMAIYYANIVSFSSDLERETERHRAMAQRLRGARRLADVANHGKSVFLAKMSRELKQPLDTIVGSSRALLGRIAHDPETASWQPEVERIEAAGTRLFTIVGESMDPDRLGTDPGEAVAGDVALDEAVDRAAAAIKPSISAQGHSFSVDRDPDLGRIAIDGKRLHQMLTGLATEAANRIAGGRIRLRVRRTRQGGGDWAEFQIRASGALRSGSELKPDGEFDTVQMHCALLGGLLDEAIDLAGVSYTVQLPTASLAGEMVPAAA